MLTEERNVEWKTCMDYFVPNVKGNLSKGTEVGEGTVCEMNENKVCLGIIQGVGGNVLESSL